jgi:serine/threonine protein phosphatase PrpC
MPAPVKNTNTQNITSLTYKINGINNSQEKISDAMTALYVGIFQWGTYTPSTTGNIQTAVNNGEITEEESRNHPDRNVLLRSLGSKTSLSPGFVQNLTVTTKNLVLSLESQDILLLCSDGVWDLVRDEELQAIFSSPLSSLQDGVDTTIQKVLDAGASDNATLVALQYSTSSH